MRSEALIAYAMLKVFNKKYAEKHPFLTSRLAELKQVIKGRLRLYGKRALGTQDLANLDGDARLPRSIS